MAMNYVLKENESRCREKHRAFWKGESLGVPLIYAVSERNGFSGKPWKSNAPRKDWDTTPAWHVHMVENHLNKLEFLADAMPIATVMMGLDITNAAVLAGGDYDYSSSGEMIDYRKGAFDINRPIPAFDPDHPLVIQLSACYEAVISAIGNRACINTPTTLDPLSSLYSICRAEDFFLDMANRPALILERTMELVEVYLRFYDFFHDYLVKRGYGESASWFQVFVEGKFESVRCDFSVMYSNEMFRRFALPELERICGHMDHSLFNMCSVKHARLIDPLSEVDALDGIFWNPEPYLDGVRDFIDVLKEIKRKWKCLEIVCQSVEEAVVAVRELGPDGVYVFFPEPFKDRRAVERAVEMLNRAVR